MYPKVDAWNTMEYHGIPKYSPKSVVHLVFCPNFKPWPCAVEEGFIYIMVGFRYIHSDSKWSSDSLSLQHSVYLYTQYGPNFVVLSMGFRSSVQQRRCRAAPRRLSVPSFLGFTVDPCSPGWGNQSIYTYIYIHMCIIIWKYRYRQT